MRWPLQPLQPFQQTQLQPPFGQSVASLCHPWFATTNFSYRFPIFETSATALCGTTGIYTFTYLDMYIYIYIRIYAYGDFHYTCAFDVMSLSPGSMWWCYRLRRWYHLWLRRYEEGRAVDLGRRTAMESWVSKRVLRDLVAQGIHYLLYHVAGPFHPGFVCNWQGQLFWFWWIPPLPAVSFTLVAEPRAPATSV